MRNKAITSNVLKIISAYEAACETGSAAMQLLGLTENLQAMLEELGLSNEIIDEVMTVVASTHDDILNL